MTPASIPGPPPPGAVALFERIGAALPASEFFVDWDLAQPAGAWAARLLEADPLDLPDWLGLSDDEVAGLGRLLDRFRASPDWRRLCDHAARRLYQTTPPIRSPREWPALFDALGPEAPLFHLALALPMPALTRDLHTRMKIAPDVTGDTVRQLLGFMLNARKGHGGRPGIMPQQLWWLRKYTDGTLFRLGRLESYRAVLGEEYDGGCHVFRHHESGEVVVLSIGGLHYDAEGWITSPHGNPTPPAWSARLRIEPRMIQGHPIDPRGFARPGPVHLDPAQWEHVLSPESTVLSMHIPADGGPLTTGALVDSLRRNLAFHRRLAPDSPPQALACRSWMFSPMLERFMPSGSNLVANLDLVRRWPVPLYGPHDGLWSVFCPPDGVIDPTRLKAKTRFESALLEHLRQGGPWREGAMLMLPEDLPQG